MSHPYLRKIYLNYKLLHFTSKNWYEAIKAFMHREQRERQTNGLQYNRAK